MDEGGRIGFQRCYTCGKWHPLAGAYSGRYCSRECARAYRRCSVCGEYFESASGELSEFCSAECAGIDDRDKPDDVSELEEEAESEDPSELRSEQ